MLKRFSSLSLICALALASNVSGARAESADQKEGSVTGIFDGFVVGGTSKHTAKGDTYQPAKASPRRPADSFAVNPQSPPSAEKPNTNHPKLDIIPGVDAPIQRASVPSRVAPPAAKPVGDESQGAAATPNQLTPAYYQSLIKQTKGISDKQSAPQGQSKYTVTDANRF